MGVSEPECYQHLRGSMVRNVINILGVSEPEHGGQPRSELGGQPGRNMQQDKLSRK